MIRNSSFWRGTTILAATTFLSYGLGFLRDRLFARTFGASAQLDAYNAAFIVPDLILNIFVAGALSAAFTPVFGELLARGNRGDAEKTMSGVMNGTVIVVFGVGLLAVLFAPLLARVVAPGLEPAAVPTLIDLTRLLTVSPVVFAISNTLGSVLLTTKRFFFYGISPALYNLGIIAGAWFFAPYLGIYGVVVGTLAGSLLHLGVRFIGMYGLSLRYTLSLAFSAQIKKIALLMLPKMIGHPVEQLTFFGFTAIASTLGAGSIAVLNFARNFQSVPVGVIGIAAGLAIFPFLTETSAQKNRAEFHEQLLRSVVYVFLLTLGAALMMYALSDWLIRLLLGGGKFDAEAIHRTATTLAVFTLAIPTESVSHVLVRAFYALKNTWLPVSIGLLGLAITIPAAYFFSFSFGIQALPLGFFIGSLIKVMLLGLLFTREENKFFTP